MQEAQQWRTDVQQWRMNAFNLLDVLLILMLILASVVRYLLSTPITKSYKGASSPITLTVMRGEPPEPPAPTQLSSRVVCFGMVSLLAAVAWAQLDPSSLAHLRDIGAHLHDMGSHVQFREG